MRKPVQTPSSCRRTLRPLAVAAAAALLASAAGTVTAQTTYYNGAGSISAFPADPTNPVFDLGGGVLGVGISAPGSFSALSGAQLTAAAVGIASGGLAGSVGSVTFDGIDSTSLVPTTVLLGGGGNRLDIGNWGTGTLTVSGGALVDATVNAAVCPGGFCNNFVGNGAGSTGTLNITGAGSEVRALRNFIVGQTAVSTIQGGSGSDFGTPGGTTNAFVNVLAGGSLRTERATVGSNNASPNGLGTEKAIGTVLIDGAGSQWILKHNSIDNVAAGLTLGTLAGGEGYLTVSNGGKVLIDGSAGPGPNDFLNIAVNGGKGALTVTGAGSSVDVIGKNTVLQVGRSGAGAQGSFSLLAGATASSLYVNVGRDSASGTMLIDGAGSVLTQAGVGSPQSFPPSTNGPAFAHVGRNGGTGSVTVSNGGQWLISDGAGDGRTAQASPGIALGRDANASGSLLITGAGSTVQIVSTSLNPAAGVGDNYNPFFAVGFDNAATSSGTLTVSDGGKLVLTGNALSTQANGRTTQLAIGGRSGTAATGAATVTGVGSEIIIQGNSALINVGREAGGNGTLNVLAGGKVSSTSMAVGISTTGTVNIDNSWIALSGNRTDTNPLVGAGTTIGRGVGGIGALNMSNGARLTIDPTMNTSGIGVGGDQFLSGGTGTVTMSGGSSIVIGGPLSGNGMTVGRTGTGNVNLSGGSFIDVGSTGIVDLGRSPGGVGNLSLASGSKLKGGDISFGGNNDNLNAGGIAAVTVTGAGSEIVASGDLGRVLVGRSGVASLSVTNQGTITAKNLTVGRAGTGTFNADNAVINLSGEQVGGFGAALSVGNRGGNGTATINNSAVTITNNTAAGANLNVGGTAVNALGTGVLNLTGGTQVQINAAPGLGSFNIGYDGSGTVNMSGAGTAVSVNNGGAAYVGRQVGSTGTLVMSNATVLNAGFVGVGVSAAGTGNQIGAAGGTGTLVLNDDSIIRAPRFELGAGSTLSGSGTIEAGPTGQVVIAGTISPGNSPGRIRIRCDVTMLFGSQLILEVDGTGANVEIDQLIIGDDSNFDLTQLQIVFAFIGNTNPEAVNLDLNQFLRAEAPNGQTSSLATLFGEGQDWGNSVDSGLFAFRSSVYDVSAFEFNADTGQITGVEAAAIPEPATYALVLLALATMMRAARRRVPRR